MENHAEFTKKMKSTHTIYMPDMLTYHNDLLCAAFRYGGYRLKVVPEYEKLSQKTFSTIGKDYCTCATYIVGNLLTLLESGDCDRFHTAFLEPQAGGACRAGNYYNLIIECLKKSGYSDIPVISLNPRGENRHSGFQINPRMVVAALAAVCYGDLLMALYQQLRPYEKKPGEALCLWRKWIKRLEKGIENGHFIFHRTPVYEQIARDFSRIATDHTKKRTRVGIVGEIYIKFSPVGNRHLEDFLREQNCDYRMGGFLNYVLYLVHAEITESHVTRKHPAYVRACHALLNFLSHAQRQLNSCLHSHGFSHDGSFFHLKSSAENIISDSYHIGDGWLMTGEAIHLIEQHYDHILFVHPFGCLVSHVGGRGVVGQLNRHYPGIKISSVEFDYEQAEALLKSRILLGIN